LLIFSLINKDDIFNNKINLRILNELFTKNEVFWSKYLYARVDALEFQNFKLNLKHEKYSNSINNYIDEIIEFIEVISDIKNVVNQVYESQTLTQEFLLIRETLNSRDPFLKTQKNFFLEEKKNIDKELSNDLKFDLLLSHDKISENYINILQNEKREGINNLIEDKILELQNKINTLACYDDFLLYREEKEIERIDESVNKRSNNMKNMQGIVNENFGLKTKFLKLKKIFYDMIWNKDIELNEDVYLDLHSIMNTNYDIVFNEDLFGLINAQAFLYENK
jgi:hypothetical protein